MSKQWTISRRRAVKLGTAAAALPLVHIRTAGAAGTLNVGFWDHWVPGANEVMRKQVQTWADKNKVEVTADFITSNNGKLALTPAAETQARAGHDMMTFFTWDVHNHADHLEPVDEVMQRLIAANGDVTSVCTYLAKAKSHWAAVPTSSGTQTKPPCARISWFKKHGLDLQAMYPPREEKNALQDAWTWDAFLKYAELAAKDNMTFALGMGAGGNTDATDMHGALFAAYGATLIDTEGNLQLDSAAMHQFLEFAQRLVKFYPADAVSFDDASNNRALIADKTALIFNPPSAWAVARRDNIKVAADCWAFPAPAGPEGRFRPAAIRQADRLQDLGGGRAAEGHRVQLPAASVERAETVTRRIRGGARSGCANLQSRGPQPDARPPAGGPDNPASHRLGEGRSGRLPPITMPILPQHELTVIEISRLEDRLYEHNRLATGRDDGKGLAFVAVDEEGVQLGAIAEAMARGYQAV